MQTKINIQQPFPISQMGKTHIRCLVKNFVTHRENMYKNFGAHFTDKHLKSVEKIKRYMGHYEKSDTRGHYNLIVTLEQDLLTLLPGKTSRFHKGWSSKITDLISFCTSQVKG